VKGDKAMKKTHRIIKMIGLPALWYLAWIILSYTGPGPKGSLFEDIIFITVVAIHSAVLIAAGGDPE
jgi:hypothetical protein